MFMAERPSRSPVEEGHPRHASSKRKPVIAVEPFSIIMVVTDRPAPSLSSPPGSRVRRLALAAGHRALVRHAVELVAQTLAGAALGPAAVLRAEAAHQLAREHAC